MCYSGITDDDLKGQIASKLSDYRHVPVGGMNVDHVSRWINQFRPDDRRFVLEETDRLLGIGYFSEQKYQQMITELIEDEVNAELFENAGFLDIQDNGSSQHEFIEFLCNESLYDVNVVTRLSERDRVRSFRNFVYVDDVSFSGTKAINDLVWLIGNYQLRNITIYVYFLGGHTFAEWKIKSYLENEFSDQNITISVVGGEYRCVENRLSYKERSGVFWPTAESVEIPDWVSNSVIYTGTYRNGYIPNENFPDEQRRDRFEAILTAIGFNILANSDNPSDFLKPLGFSTFRGVGFGGTTFTYRNCPNNTPLAFWWGDYRLTGTPALDCWYPLMKRIVYNR